MSKSSEESAAPRSGRSQTTSDGAFPPELTQFIDTWVRSLEDAVLKTIDSKVAELKAHIQRVVQLSHSQDETNKNSQILERLTSVVESLCELQKRPKNIKDLESNGAESGNPKKNPPVTEPLILQNLGPPVSRTTESEAPQTKAGQTSSEADKIVPVEIRQAQECMKKLEVEFWNIRESLRPSDSAQMSAFRQTLDPKLIEAWTDLKAKWDDLEKRSLQQLKSAKGDAPRCEESELQAYREFREKIIVREFLHKIERLIRDSPQPVTQVLDPLAAAVGFKVITPKIHESEFDSVKNEIDPSLASNRASLSERKIIRRVNYSGYVDSQGKVVAKAEVVLGDPV